MLVTRDSVQDLLNLPNHTVFGEEELSIYLLELTWHTAVGSTPPKKISKSL